MKTSLKIISLTLLAMAVLQGCSSTTEGAPNKDVVAVFTTNQGVIKANLYTKEAPLTTQNFIDLAKDGKYDNTIFHRVITDFMVQAGDFENSNGTGGYSAKGPGTSIPDEFGKGLEHSYGALSMANAGPNTGGSQFFIVQAKDGTPWLDGRHAIFGQVFEGMEIVDKIANVETLPGDKPVDDVVLEKVEIK